MVETETLVRPGVKEFSRSSYSIAMDLGQANDPSAIAIIEHLQTQVLSVKGEVLERKQRFDLRHIETLPLQLSYVEQAAYVEALLQREPLVSSSEFALDYTGVGRPVSNIFEAAGLRPICVSITSGEQQVQHGLRHFGVPKKTLISALDARLHTGEFRVAAGLSEANALAEELKDFRRKTSSVGRFSYDARTGRHDDRLIAAALALWVHVGRPIPPTPYVGRYSYVNHSTR